MNLKSMLAGVKKPVSIDFLVRDGVWGQNVTILPGVHIGDGAIIGMNSVVGKDIPPYTIVAGNPVKAIRKRFDDEIIRLMLQLKWWDLPIEAFNKLAVNVFDLSFEAWYEKGYWRDKYFPYTLFEGDRAIANVSASMIHTVVNGEPKLYIQIGTVMTDDNYRKRGLSSRLLQELIKEWQDKCDGIYLYANDTVLDFYPKFGFEKVTEYGCSKPVDAQPTGFIKLKMDQKEDVKLLENYYNKGNPFSERPMLHNFGLLMFYCGTFMKDCVYYSEELKCVVIASYEENVMTCYDIYCDEIEDRDFILQSMAQKQTTTVHFGFMPKDTKECTVDVLENEDQLFIYSNKENMFNKSKMMLPLLSHA